MVAPRLSLRPHGRVPGHCTVSGKLRGQTGCRCSCPPPFGLLLLPRRDTQSAPAAANGVGALAYQNTARQRSCQIRSVARSAQRHQGGARRAGDSRGAECVAGLIRSGAGLCSERKDMGPRLREDDGARGPLRGRRPAGSARGRQQEWGLTATGWSAASRFPGTAPRRAFCAGSSRHRCRRCRV